MPYDFDVSDPIERYIDGLKHLTWTVTEIGEVGASDEWVIDGVPTPYTTTLIDGTLVNGNSEATGIRIEVGTAPGFALGTAAAIGQAGSSASYNRIDTDHRVHGVEGAGQIVGRSKPDTPITANGEIVTTVTIKVGH